MNKGPQRFQKIVAKRRLIDSGSIRHLTPSPQVQSQPGNPHRTMIPALVCIAGFVNLARFEIEDTIKKQLTRLAKLQGVEYDFTTEAK